MSLFSKLFGKSAAKEPTPEEHKGFQIFPEPIKESGGYRISARIEKEIDGEVKSHTMIRADTYSGLDTATEASLTKAMQFIDQQGERIFSP